MTDIFSGRGSEPDPPKFPDSSAVLSNLSLVFTVSIIGPQYLEWTKIEPRI